jgi:hypothetical protein
VRRAAARLGRAERSYGAGQVLPDESGLGGSISFVRITRCCTTYCRADWDMVAYVQDRKGHDQRYVLNDSVLRSLGFEPRVPFKQGLAETVRWYEVNRSWWEPLRQKQVLDLAPRLAASAGLEVPGREPAPLKER